MSCVNRLVVRIVCCMLLGIGTGHAQTFSGVTWLPLTQQGGAYADPYDATLTPDVDIVGDRSNPAAFIASDAGFLYFRLRLTGTPISPINHRFTSNAWACLLDADADPSTYELLTAVDGKVVPNVVALYQNTSTSKPDSIDDPAETLLTTYSVANGAAEVIDAKSALGGPPAQTNYFVDWAVAWSDLAVSLQTGSPFRLVCGSSTAETSLTAGDVLDNGSGSVSFSATASDAVFCDAGGCNYDAVFKDGFEGP